MKIKRNLFASILFLGLFGITQVALADHQHRDHRNEGHMHFHWDHGPHGYIVPEPWGPPDPWVHSTVYPGPWEQPVICYYEMTPWGPIQKCRYY